MTLGVEKISTLIIKDSKGVFYTHSVSTRVELKNAVTGKIEDAAIWDIEDNRNGSVLVSIVPKIVGQYDVSILIGNKRIQGAPWRVLFTNDDRLYDNFPIIINPVLKEAKLVMFPKHAIQDSEPSKHFDIDYPPLIEAIKECDTYWPRNINILHNICLDYGRSHYFFTDGDESLPAKIHIFGFGNYGTATTEERNIFFTKFGLKGDFLKIFQEPSPTRSNLLTRVKYELLQRYILSKDKTENEASRLALAILASTTQHTLRHLSSLIIDALPQLYRQQISFCYFQINIFQQNNEIYLKFSFINYVPTSGVWQSSPTKPLPKNNRKNMRVEIEFNMEGVDERGVMTIMVEGNHEYFGRGLLDHERRQKFGIFMGAQQTAIPFKDTSPTW